MREQIQDDTISKQSLLEWMEAELTSHQSANELFKSAGFDSSDHPQYQLYRIGVTKVHNTSRIIEEINSGRFDSPSNQGEVQRLRAALEEAKRHLSLQRSWGEYTAKAYGIIDEALSTTTEPTGAQYTEKGEQTE